MKGYYMQKLELFPTPVAIFDIEDHQNIKTELLSIDELNSNASFLAKHDIWDYKEKYECLGNLHSLFLEKAAEYLNAFYDEQYTADMFFHKRGWYSVRKSMDHLSAGAGLHNHRMTTIAMTYYVDVYDDSSPIHLLDSRSQLNWASLDDSKTYHQYKHQPKSGQLIMFPGWLFHDVPINKGSHFRIALTSNIQLKESYKTNLM
jgi:hypothetical protein